MRYRYWGYSVAAFLVWAVVLAIIWSRGNANNTHDLLLVFLGWAIAWASTSIARIVDPPPKRWFDLRARSWSVTTDEKSI
jgi:hypothetical protein